MARSHARRARVGWPEDIQSWTGGGIRSDSPRGHGTGLLARSAHTSMTWVGAKCEQQLPLSTACWMLESRASQSVFNVTVC